MKNHVSDAELMRQLLNKISNPSPRRLYESVALQEEQVILETERQVQETLIPAFHAVFESYKGRLQEADAQGYTDEELLALAKKYPNIQDLIAAHINLRDEPATQDLDKDSALRTLKGAAATILKKTQNSDPLVPRPMEWVANREDKLQQALRKSDPKGKYKKLSAIFQKLSKVVKNHPKTANAVVGLMGVSIPILASGYWWAAPAALILTKTVTDMLNGASFKSAVAKNITFTAIGAAIGGAIRYSDAISNTLDSWLTGEATPVLRGDIEAGGEMPRDPNLSMRMDPELRGDVEAGSEMPRNPDLSNASDDAPAGTGQQQAATSTTKQQIDNKLPELDEPGEAGSDDDSQIDSQTSGEAGDYAPTVPIPAQEYTVQRGDNLSTLAQKNNISVRELMAANPQITNPDQLRAGETINIPSETGSKTYDQGVGTRSDTQAGLRSGRFTNRQGF